MHSVFLNRCYSQALHLQNDESFLWHDLSMNYLFQYKLTADMAAIESAVKFVTKAIALDGTVSAHYCLLGTIYMEPGLKDVQLSQMYLIKSIELNSKVLNDISC